MAQTNCQQSGGTGDPCLWGPAVRGDSSHDEIPGPGLGRARGHVLYFEPSERAGEVAMEDFDRKAFRKREARRIISHRVFYLHLSIWAATNLFLVVVWAVTGRGYPWFVFPLFGWAIFLTAHGVAAFLFTSTDEIVSQREQRRLAASEGRSAGPDPSRQ